MNARDVIARLFPANKVWSIRPYVAADLVLDALRDAGFEVYRPDECDTIGLPWRSPTSPAGTYRLVPVESPKENE